MSEKKWTLTGKDPLPHDGLTKLDRVVLEVMKQAKEEGLENLTKDELALRIYDSGLLSHEDMAISRAEQRVDEEVLPPPGTRCN